MSIPSVLSATISPPPPPLPPIPDPVIPPVAPEWTVDRVSVDLSQRNVVVVPPQPVDEGSASSSRSRSRSASEAQAQDTPPAWDANANNIEQPVAIQRAREPREVENPCTCDPCWKICALITSVVLGSLLVVGGFVTGCVFIAKRNQNHKLETPGIVLIVVFGTVLLCLKAILCGKIKS